MTAVCPACHAYMTVQRGVIRVHGNGRGLCRGSGMVPETEPAANEAVTIREVLNGP